MGKDNDSERNVGDRHPSIDALLDEVKMLKSPDGESGEDREEIHDGLKNTGGGLGGVKGIGFQKKKEADTAEHKADKGRTGKRQIDLVPKNIQNLMKPSTINKLLMMEVEAANTRGIPDPIIKTTKPTK